ncbi:exodeoxyribonuclease VII large subunit [Candidatus Uhrbacteria bacterium CG_4_9_14_3_um_filter_41_35]|uniref:Exodeoxyribonuclease 7 large subunit n=1 Tax=Candidatus Uhrbacteria bacterium CG_4_9_14_3_um_filter_41_35 TaxID=1975034 RepID=A0A2M7XFL1_9BACT|nr:MAG: exodeoxyribonuclease VII large subunit [Candidatus Uhrbacteria bacterium CG11_big_fil_rev_8_21_14_0_20_41_9]PJA46667.1 MAG: exodeoxyribonuclease VII large subunit [Candidatus Uhrbacteria bacterium CG_4_9_14_3_um_filter_41_35]
MENKIITVADYLRLVNDTLALIPSEAINIIGEIVDYKVSQGKWINFDLKDQEEEVKISCFATTFKIQLPLESGMKISVKGYPKVYERFGKFSLNVIEVELVGVGTLQKAYEALKKKLQAEGLFSTERKRSIPKFPARIGLITSGEAAAYGDFLRILNNRWSGVEVVHIPVTVQGQHAVREIIEAFDQFNALPSTEKPEVIVLTRGGGSLEDLHAFNDEQTARAVFQSTIPVVVGVGHERDESLCDFVADVRASTPSNAAERIVPNRADILREIGTTANRMEDVLKLSLERKTRTVDHGISKIDQIITSKLVNMRSKVDGMVRLFKAFDVQKSLDRGFSIVRKDGKIVKDANKVGLKDVIEVQLAKGRVNSLVIAKDLGK